MLGHEAVGWTCDTTEAGEGHMGQVGAPFRREGALDTGAVDLTMQMLKGLVRSDCRPNTVKPPLALKDSDA